MLYGCCWVPQGEELIEFMCRVFVAGCRRAKSYDTGVAGLQPVLLHHQHQHQHQLESNPAKPGATVTPQPTNHGHSHSNSSQGSDSSGSNLHYSSLQQSPSEGRTDGHAEGSLPLGHHSQHSHSSHTPSLAAAAAAAAAATGSTGSSHQLFYDDIENVDVTAHVSSQLDYAAALPLILPLLRLET